MCAPVLIPVMAAAAGAGGAAAAGATTAGIAAAGVMGAASGASAGAEMQAAEYGLNLAKEGKRQKEAEAENVRIAGSQEAGQALIDTKKAEARARTQFAAGGVSTSAGTPLDISQDIAEVGALESMTILSNADRQAFGLEQMGKQEVAQARSRKKTSKIGALATILGSAAGGYGGGASTSGTNASRGGFTLMA